MFGEPKWLVPHRSLACFSCIWGRHSHTWQPASIPSISKDSCLVYLSSSAWAELNDITEMAKRQDKISNVGFEWLVMLCRSCIWYLLVWLLNQINAINLDLIPFDTIDANDVAQRSDFSDHFGEVYAVSHENREINLCICRSVTLFKIWTLSVPS